MGLHSPFVWCASKFTNLEFRVTECQAEADSHDLIEVHPLILKNVLKKRIIISAPISVGVPLCLV